MKKDKGRKLAERILRVSAGKKRIGNSDMTRAKKKKAIMRAALHDNTRGARALAPGRLDFQSNLGRFVEAFPDATILNGRAFCT